jgi:hypothetical protein
VGGCGWGENVVEDVFEDCELPVDMLLMVTPQFERFLTETLNFSVELQLLLVYKKTTQTKSKRVLLQSVPAQWPTDWGR